MTRALLIAASLTEGSAELVRSLAPEADLVVAVDGGGAACLSAGVSPDVLLGDFDSIDAATFAQLEAAGARIERFPAEKDETDLELALAFVSGLDVTDVVVTGASAGRLDHTLAAVGALARFAALRPALVEPELAAWVLSPDGRDEIVVSGQGATLSVIALAGDSCISIAGTRWPLDHHTLAAGAGLGVGNLIAAEAGATVTVHEGVVMVLAPHVPDAVVPPGHALEA